MSPRITCPKTSFPAELEGIPDDVREARICVATQECQDSGPAAVPIGTASKQSIVALLHPALQHLAPRPI
ncbi:predicted protein [Plenodomus lingam JN3]|uniref:Predicted protein n=1 Tax=Leptosphaeria maculans (strain JN3 / isolate v23.1.3 / race Av1-4-5-6-7-8) TaxID=985895 RepID=E5A2X9_LEPMJ|nr:predicted protein [Plenodomus lingam JN3]CBX97992.1 predicted protein [Plenodomus lingam JN3]